MVVKVGVVESMGVEEREPWVDELPLLLPLGEKV